MGIEAIKSYIYTMQTAKEIIDRAIFSADPRWREKTRRAMQPYLDQFSSQLAHIYSIMPIKMLVTSEGVERIIDPEWQSLIDKVKEQQQETLRSLFPEYFR